MYYFGVSDDKHGAVKLSRSVDDGLTWTQSVLRGDERYTTGATAVTVAQGRIWRAFEGGPKRTSMVFSADAASDLLDPKSWLRTAPLAFNLSWIPPGVRSLPCPLLACCVVAMRISAAHSVPHIAAVENNNII
eukprot:SAG31_NODE_1395_length_8516_cov_4.162885_1_plen_133_part_00